MDILQTDEQYMELALQLARPTIGQTGTNPSVGCVIVQQGRVVGMGAHLRLGGAHAEVHALQMAGDEARGATAYVTLEPCNHHGRTPPCTEALIAAGIGRVVIAATDPDPRVSGNGIKRLQDYGTKVVVGVLEQASREMNRAYEYLRRTGLPYVAIKSASTLDGRIATKTGHSQWITSAESRKHGHHLRQRYPAIMAGIGTVIADNPQLTVRLEGSSRQPQRIVVDTMLRMPLSSQMLADGHGPVWILASAEASEVQQQKLEAQGVVILHCPTQGLQLDLRAALQLLADRGISAVLVEGGGRLQGSLLEQSLAQRLYLYIAPVIVGGKDAVVNFDWPGVERMEQAIRLQRTKWESIGDDLCLIGDLPQAAAPSELQVQQAQALQQTMITPNHKEAEA